MLLDPTPFLKRPERLLSGTGIEWFNRTKLWMVRVDADTAEEAEAMGRKLQRELASKRSLTAADPYLHHVPLVVLYGDDQSVELPGLEESARRPKAPGKADLRRSITDRGKAFFGNKGFTLSGAEGRYHLTFRPALKKFRGVFSETSTSAKTLEEAAEKLDQAIEKLSPYANPAKLKTKLLR